MKKPKATNRYCPFCRKKTEHKIKLLSSTIKRGTMARGSLQRAKKRGLGRGFGNLGKWGSKPPMTKWKRKTKKTKKAIFLYTCQECKKAHQSKKGLRSSKVLME
ncbi:MAG TPA: 50S ribosomal protein L44e [Candidatus Paceibacterota bacterium]|nr:50S ribosomal protein L44e [Candidatus Paceibacterota bacterium]